MRQPGHVNLIGTSPAIVDLTAEVQRVARSLRKCKSPGGGVGRTSWRGRSARPARADAAFVPVNRGIRKRCSVRLFGHVKGSFTGACRDKPGKLEMANGGTIFLDEIGEMTLRMQGLFLRFLETGELQKVGAERIATAPNVRVIAATNRNLQEQITLGQFREDLFYRLNVIHLVVPPLRDRREDIPLLIEHFLRSFMSKGNGQGNGNGNGNGNGRGIGEGAGGGQENGNGQGYANGHGAVVRAIAPEAVAVLCQYAWPGNVRQLENVIERLVVTGQRDVIAVEDLPMEVRTPSQIGVRPKRDRRRTVADDLFKKLLEERESFWTAVYPLYMDREITRGNVGSGPQGARGSPQELQDRLRLFNMESSDYKRF